MLMPVYLEVFVCDLPLGLFAGRGLLLDRHGSFSGAQPESYHLLRPIGNITPYPVKVLCSVLIDFDCKWLHFLSGGKKLLVHKSCLSGGKGKVKGNCLKEEAANGVLAAVNLFVLLN